MAKSYLYKVYDSTGTTLITTWADVISAFNYSQEINGPGSEVVVRLARAANSFGENSDVKFKNQVQIYVVDAEAPSGSLIFKGFINNYSPVYGDNEYVDVVVLGYGFELNNILIDNVIPTTAFFNIDAWGSYHNAGYSFGNGGTYKFLAQNFIMSGNHITQVKLNISAAPGVGTMKMGIFADSGGFPGAQVGSYVTANVANGATLVTFDASVVPIEVTDSLQYWVVFQDLTNSQLWTPVESLGDPLGGFGVVGTTVAAGTSGWANIGGGGVAGSGNDLYLSIYNDNPDTTVAHPSEDPSEILIAIMDDYRLSHGGTISYTLDVSLEHTLTTVSYTFNTNTILEGIKKCLELAPTGWYWYIDQATNLLHFHKKAAAPQVFFTLGKDILNISAEKRSEDIINTVYFTGNGLFKRYINQASVDTYGVRLLRYQDQRVTSATTAQIIANTYLQKAAPEVRIKMTIADSNSSPNTGYDIDSLHVGQVIGLRGFGNSNTSLWDVAQWDVSMWDFNVAQLETLSLQITRVEYSESYATIYASSIPVDVNKRIEDINRNLELSQTFNNAATPS